ncbi:MAG: hypothetical protein Q4Q06_08130 [Bacteroidota bacterium]|nr:hypothetical protein [Bacteroidota bacterium]
MKKLFLAIVVLSVSLGAYCQQDNEKKYNLKLVNKSELDLKTDKNLDSINLSKPIMTINSSKSDEIFDWVKVEADKGNKVVVTKKEDGTFVAKSFYNKDLIIDINNGKKEE